MGCQGFFLARTLFLSYFLEWSVMVIRSVRAHDPHDCISLLSPDTFHCVQPVSAAAAAPTGVIEWSKSGLGRSDLNCLVYSLCYSAIADQQIYFVFKVGEKRGRLAGIHLLLTEWL